MLPKVHKKLGILDQSPNPQFQNNSLKTIFGRFPTQGSIGISSSLAFIFWSYIHIIILLGCPWAPFALWQGVYKSGGIAPSLRNGPSWCRVAAFVVGGAALRGIGLAQFVAGSLKYSTPYTDILGTIWSPPPSQEKKGIFTLPHFKPKVIDWNKKNVTDF